jgi:hypothetical protein
MEGDMSHEQDILDSPITANLRVARARVHPSWRLCVSTLLEGYPEIESVSFARIGIEEGDYLVLYLMAIHYRRFIPGPRLRELELHLKRIFRRRDGEVLVVMKRERSITDAVPILELIREKGVQLYLTHGRPS